MWSPGKFFTHFLCHLCLLTYLWTDFLRTLYQLISVQCAQVGRSQWIGRLGGEERGLQTVQTWLSTAVGSAAIPLVSFLNKTLWVFLSSEQHCNTWNSFLLFLSVLKNLRQLSPASQNTKWVFPSRRLTYHKISQEISCQFYFSPPCYYI